MPNLTHAAKAARLGAGSVVFSADTIYFPPLAEFARGADILVHGAIYGPGVDRLVARVGNGARLKEHLLASHTLAEAVGRIAASGGVGLLALIHWCRRMIRR